MILDIFDCCVVASESSLTQDTQRLTITFVGCSSSRHKHEARISLIYSDLICVFIDSDVVFWNKH